MLRVRGDQHSEACFIASCSRVADWTPGVTRYCMLLQEGPQPSLFFTNHCVELAWNGQRSDHHSVSQSVRQAGRQAGSQVKSVRPN